MTIPFIVHQAWFGGERPERIRQFMIGARKFHLGWDIKIWNEDNIKDLGLDVAQLKDKCVNWAGVSNVVRLHAVNKFGGVWLDSDVEVLKPFTPLLNHKAFAARQDTDRLCNAVWGAVEGHPFVKWQIKHQDKLMTQDAATGVYLMSEAPRYGVQIVPTPWFYPWSYDSPVEARHPQPSSFAVHWWSGSWQK